MANLQVIGEPCCCAGEALLLLLLLLLLLQLLLLQLLLLLKALPPLSLNGQEAIAHLERVVGKTEWWTRCSGRGHAL